MNKKLKQILIFLVVCFNHCHITLQAGRIESASQFFKGKGGNAQLYFIIIVAVFVLFVIFIYFRSLKKK